MKKVEYENNKTKVWQIVRWIFFIPLSLFIYALSKDIITWTFSLINSNMVADISSADDFVGYYFLGPVYIFIMESLATGFSIYSGVYLVPKYKKIIFIGFVIPTILILLYFLYFSYNFGSIVYTKETKEVLLRGLTEITGSLCGIIIAGIYIWKEQKKILVENMT